MIKDLILNYAGRNAFDMVGEAVVELVVPLYGNSHPVVFRLAAFSRGTEAPSTADFTSPEVSMSRVSRRYQSNEKFRHKYVCVGAHII